VVKTLAANEKLGIVLLIAERSEYDGNALQRHAFERCRLLEPRHFSRAGVRQRKVLASQVTV